MGGSSRQSRDDPEAWSPRTLFFVHVPKCAGTSFRHVLRRWYGADAMFFDSHDPKALRRAVLARRSFPRAIAGHFVFGVHADLPCRPRFVSIVRDPLDRFVSLYRYVRTTPGHPLHEAAAGRDLAGFYDWTLNQAGPRRQTVGIQCRFLSGEPTFEAAGAAVDAQYDLIAPIERLQDFANACARLVGRPVVAVGARNVTAADAQTEAARADIAASLRREHRDDLMLYEHVRGRFDARLERPGPAGRGAGEAAAGALSRP